MNEQNLHKLFKNLSEPSTVLPLHKEKLRARLLAKHKQTVRQPFGAFLIGVQIMKKRALLIGVPVALVAAFAFVGMSLTNPQPVTAQQLLQGATKAAIALSPEKLRQFNEQHKQDLMNRLEEAKTHRDLKVMTEADLKAWGFLPKPMIHAYLGYTDSQGHRIIIGLTENEEPIFIHDISLDGMSAKGTTMQDGSGVGSGSVDLPVPQN